MLVTTILTGCLKEPKQFKLTNSSENIHFSNSSSTLDMTKLSSIWWNQKDISQLFSFAFCCIRVKVSILYMFLVIFVFSLQMLKILLIFLLCFCHFRINRHDGIFCLFSLICCHIYFLVYYFILNFVYMMLSHTGICNYVIVKHIDLPTYKGMVVKLSRIDSSESSQCN